MTVTYFAPAALGKVYLHSLSSISVRLLADTTGLEDWVNIGSNCEGWR